MFEAGPDRSSSRLYGGALAASAVSAVLAAHLLDDPTAGVPVLLALTAFLAFFGLVADVGFTLLDPRDLGLLRTLPVSSSAFFRARCTALGGSLLLKTLSFGLVPAAVLGVLYGPREALAYPLVLAALLATLANLACGLLLLMQRLVDPARLRDALIFLQVAIFVVGTAGWLLLLQGGLGDDRGSGLAAFAPDWLPTRFFAGAWSSLAGHGVDASACVVVAGAVVASVGLLVWTAPRYLGLLARIEEVPSRRHRGERTLLRRWFERAFVHDDERAAFRLALALLRRERTFRLQTYPLMAYPILFLAFGRGHDDGGLFCILFAHLTTIYLPIVGVFLRFSDAPQASWVWRIHGQQSLAAHWSGARKALIWALVFPIGLIVTGLLVFEGGVSFGLGHGLFTLGVMVWVTLSAPVPDDVPPFSEAFAGGVQAQDEIKQVYPLFLLVIALAMLQFGLARTGWAALTLGAVGIAVGARLLRRGPGPGAPVSSLESPPQIGGAAVGEGNEGPPFRERMRAEVRGLATMYAVLALFGCVVGLFM